MRPGRVSQIEPTASSSGCGNSWAPDRSQEPDSLALLPIGRGPTSPWPLARAGVGYRNARPTFKIIIPKYKSIKNLHLDERPPKNHTNGRSFIGASSS